MKRRVLVSSFYDRPVIAPALQRLEGEAEVVLCSEGRTLKEDELIRYLRDIDVVIAAEEPYNARVFNSAPSLKMIARDGVGVDSVDLREATRHGVIVNIAPVVHESVADLTFGLILAAVRRIVLCDRGMRSGRWLDRDKYLSHDVNGMTLGLLGFGKIGQAVAARARGFNMPVLAHDSAPDTDKAQRLQVRLVALDELPAEADILSVHVPLSTNTEGIVNREFLAKMKRGAYLINTSRGRVVDEDALYQALTSGHLRGAGLDVLSEEPPPKEHPLFALDTVVFTPHVGSDTFGTFLKVFQSQVDDILLFLHGQRPQHVMNREVFGWI